MWKPSTSPLGPLASLVASLSVGAEARRVFHPRAGTETVSRRLTRKMGKRLWKVLVAEPHPGPAWATPEGIHRRSHRDKSLPGESGAAWLPVCPYRASPTDTLQIPSLPGGSQACSLASCYYTVFYSLELI